MFHRLGDIDNIDLVLIVKHVVFTEICVDELAFLIQNSHYLHNLEIDLTPSLHSIYLRVFQPRSVLHVLADEVHHQNVGFHEQSNGADDDSLHSLQVSQLFLGPHADHLPRVAGTVPSSEPKLSLHVSIPILEHQNGGFVDLYGVLFLGVVVDRVVHVSLFAGR